MTAASRSDLAGLARRLETYLAPRLGNDGPVRVTGLERISGGASRQTFRFVATPTNGPPRRLILRRDPAGSLIDTERGVEFAALQAFHATEVPVPEPLWLEESSGPLGHPFFIMAEVAGGEPNPLRLMAQPYAALHAHMAAQTWTILGRIARTDLATGDIGRRLPWIEPEDAWCRELDHWERVLDEDEIDPQPIQRAAIRWLRRHPPPPPVRLSVVHGDYRVGNLLFSPAGDILGVLDWEMVHLGDPLEDLAWGINRVWCMQKDDRVGGLVPREVAIGHWQAASGMVADREALRWWELFTCVKGQAIWVSAAKAFASGANRDLIMPIAAWSQGNTQDRAAIELMGW